MADHTVVGHQIVSNVQFPWPQIPEIVRWHHERGDGSGYPDGMHRKRCRKQCGLSLSLTPSMPWSALAPTANRCRSGSLAGTDSHDSAEV